MSDSFSDFISGLIKLNNEEQEDEKLWDMFMFSQAFYEKSFNEFKQSLIKNTNIEVASKKELEATVKDSIKILNGFNPSLLNGGDIYNE